MLFFLIKQDENSCVLKEKATKGLKVYNPKNG